jgi:hypothetical protein
MLELSILINKQINQMTNKIITFNEFIAEVAGRNLIEYRYGILEEEIGEELYRYLAGEEYEIHLHYLIETWKNLIDEAAAYFIKIDYERQGTFKELWNYSRCLPGFDDTWLDDIFERHILVTNVCLK